jgi:hypothetical protein
MQLPLEKAVIGGNLFCPVEPNPQNDKLFADWECPLLWKWVSSRLKIDNAFEGKPALRFNFARRTPPEVWKTNWSLWYDTAITTREYPPDDITLRATLTFEEVTTGFGSDNNVYARPWTGIIARMVDLRRYYYFCLEYPDTVALYRREDNTWACLARHSCELNPFSANTLELRLRGQYMEGYLDGQRVVSATDYAFASGRAGLRATSECFVTDFTIEADKGSMYRFNIRRDEQSRALEEARARVPKATLERIVNWKDEGKATDMRVANFCAPGAPQIFHALEEAPDGATSMLRNLDGSEIWRQKGPLPLRYQVTTPNADGLCDLVGFTRDAVILIDGRTGLIKQQRAFTTLPDPPRKMGFMPDTMADLSGRGERRDFLFTSGANDCRIWALGPDFSDIWHFTAGSGMGHNNSIAALDVDGDGRDEIFAGGSLLTADGDEIWRQQDLLRRLKAPNAGHVDATQAGFFCSDPSLPVIHMESSSAGHLVVDARDGSLLAHHPQGHVQGGCAGHFVADEPGIQVAASCRHGNYGILAIYSGDGRCLSRFQPDYRTDCPQKINWDGTGTDLLVIAKDPQRAGLYDWQGRCLVPLFDMLPAAYTAEIPNKHRDFVMKPIDDDPRDCLIVRIHNELRFIRPGDRTDIR